MASLRVFLVVLCAVLVPAASACDSSAKKPDKKIILPPPAKVTQADDDTTVTVQPDQRVEIRVIGIEPTVRAASPPVDDIRMVHIHSDRKSVV